MPDNEMDSLSDCHMMAETVLPITHFDQIRRDLDEAEQFLEACVDGYPAPLTWSRSAVSTTAAISPRRGHLSVYFRHSH